MMSAWLTLVSGVLVSQVGGVVVDAQTNQPLAGARVTWSNTSTRNTWSQDSLSLSLYAGQNVIIRFTVTTDSSYPSAFWLDDLVVK